MARIVTEDLFRAHIPQQGRHTFAHSDGLPVGKMADKGNQHEPYGERSGANDRGVFQPHDVAEPQHRRAGIDLEHQFGFVGQHRAPLHDPRRNLFGPPTERTDDEVVQAADQPAHGQQFGLITLLFPRNEHFGSGCRLREGITSLHIFDKIFPERNQQHDTEQAAEQRREENLVELRLQSQNIKRRQRENRPGDDNARSGADGLDNDILSQHIFTAGKVTHAHRDDGDGDSRFEDLPDPKAQVGGGGGKDDGHHNTEQDRIKRDLFRTARGRHDGMILFAGAQFAVCVVRQ